MGDDLHEVYAITYARVDRRSPDNFLGGDPHDVPMPLNYYVWLIVERRADHRGRHRLRPARRRIAQARDHQAGA